jgi:hypothetical protein
MTQRARLTIMSPDFLLWGSPIQQNGQLIFSARDKTISFDLAKNEANDIYYSHTLIIHRPMPTTAATTRWADPAGVASKINTAELAPPFMLLDGWLWTASPFGRISLSGKGSEDFPSLRGTDAKFFPTECLCAIDDGKRIVVADSYGIWVLQMPDAQ